LMAVCSCMAVSLHISCILFSINSPSMVLWCFPTHHTLSVLTVWILSLSLNEWLALKFTLQETMCGGCQKYFKQMYKYCWSVTVEGHHF
jgi:hypothetical protein